ncbi:MAG: outer membrane beta-barrel protein [Candidatus Nitrotoga sp.]
MKRRLLNTLILATSIVPSVVMAADAPASMNMPVPTVSDILGASGITVSGYLDVAYNKMDSTGLFVGAAGPLPGGVAGNSRIFDTHGAAQNRNFNSFNLQQAALIVSKLPKEGAGGYLNLTAGQDAATIASVGLGTSNLDVTQAYASYTKGALTVIGGKFATLAGAELITTPSNKNYSRAWMFGWGPYTHTGARATYAASDKITLIAGLNNGWDQVTSTTSTKTAELGLILAPFNMFSLATTYYHGKETAAAVGTRKYLDMIGTITVNDKLNFVFDYANGSQNDALAIGSQAKWNALALYANYQINNTWRASYRHETYDDKNGFRSGLVQKLTSHTTTVGYAVAKNMELRGEVRFDKSTVDAFLQNDGTAKKNQTSYAMQAVYQF